VKYLQVAQNGSRNSFLNKSYQNVPAKIVFVKCTCYLPHKQIGLLFTSPAGAVAKYCDEYVCLWVCLSVCLSARISPEPHAIFTNFLCVLPMSVARSSMFTIGRIAYRREGVFLPNERGMGVHSAGEVCYLRLPCFELSLSTASIDLQWICFTHCNENCSCVP